MNTVKVISMMMMGMVADDGAAAAVYGGCNKGDGCAGDSKHLCLC